MTIIEKIEEIKNIIKNDFDNNGLSKFNFFVGKPEIFDDNSNNINLNINQFPLICFTNISYNLSEGYINNYIGSINTTLIISDIDNELPIFDYLDKEILKRVLNKIKENNDIIIKSVNFDDDIPNIFSINLELDISFNYEI